MAQALAQRLAALRPTGWAPRLDEDLRALLAEAAVDRQALSRVTATTLLLKHPRVPGDASALPALAGDALLIAFLTHCLNVDPTMEGWLIGLRRRLVDTYRRTEDPPPPVGRLIAALALQAEAGEWVWPDDPQTRVALDGRDDGPGLLMTALFIPLPLAAEERSDALASLRASPEPLIHQLLKAALDDRMAEAELAAGILELTGAALTGVSAAVRAQYEQNPYPRWRDRPARPQRAIASVIADLTGAARSLSAPPLRVLVAGCGTGYEPIDLKLTDPGVDVTALDLSRVSLGYAARRARELGADIRFIAGDLLDLDPARDGLFDLATSTGVLHHLDDPAAGLARLAAVVRPGGVLRLALYSERARAPVVAARRRIEQDGLTPTEADIRAFRPRILTAAPDDALSVLTGSDDFYSLSGCRDLLFHVREHRFSAPALGELVKGAGLELLSLDVAPNANAAFSALHGVSADRRDLALWDAVEARDPSLFAGMFHVWCRKPGG